MPVADLDLLFGNGLLVWSAHPDDETLGVGGLIAAAAERGVQVHVELATGTPERLRELASALALLHPDATFSALELTDGALRAEQDRLDAAVRSSLSEYPGRTIVAPWSGDRHGDHRALGQAVSAVARDHGRQAYAYPVWLWQWGEPADVPWSDSIALPLTETARSRKRAAVRAFSSQLSGDDPVLRSGVLDWADAGREILVLEPTSADLHFELLHGSSTDPWNVRDSWYERRKRAVLLSTLRQERYRAVLELGCSIGVTTAELAGRADDVLAVDGSFAAVHAARDRTRSRPNVRIERMRLPHQWPGGAYDLVVLSELGYYFTPDEWHSVCGRVADALVSGGEVIIAHWTGDAADFLQSGTAAHHALATAMGTPADVTHLERDFLIESYHRPERS
ncbi:PIG-L family deacetylase [Rathayibacter sp. CAU 1779]